MSDNNNDLGAFLAGFVIGGLVGAAVSLILAPQSGEETRTQLANVSHDLRQTGSDRFQSVRERAGSTLADTRSRLEETSTQLEEQARIVLDAGKERATQVKDQVSDVVQPENGEAETAAAENDDEQDINPNTA